MQTELFDFSSPPEDREAGPPPLPAEWVQTDSEHSFLVAEPRWFTSAICGRSIIV